MKYHFSFLYTLFLITVIGLIGVGCTVASPTPTVTNEFATPLSVVPTALSRPIHTPTPPPPLPSTTPTPTEKPATFTPTSTLEPTSTETPVLIPTAPGKSVTEQVLWLFETNNGCQLPCWWGITPGQTTWATAASFLTILDQNIYEDLSVPELVYYEVSVPVPSEIFIVNQTDISFLVRDNRVMWILTDVSIGHTPPDHLTPYLLSNFLLVYGEPSEVWLFTYSSAFEEGDLPFIVVLFYPQRGILALYSDNGIKQGDIVQGCPQRDPVSELMLRVPELDLTFEQIVSGSSVFGRDYLSLTEATGMDVATFYETFKNPDNIVCLETPANLWEP